MKKETWLYRCEAKSWGFIDEVYAPSKVVNLADDVSIVAFCMQRSPGAGTKTGETGIDENPSSIASQSAC